MLYINNQRVIEDVIVYGDDLKMNVFYPIPEQPRFRLDKEGKPIFKFLKYRFPIDRPDGKKGGGFAVFDVEFSVPDEKMTIIKEKLQEEVNRIAQKRNISPPPPVKIGAVRYIKGTSRLMLNDENSVLVERIIDAGKPSLFGKNISTYSVELSVEGAALFEKALQGKGGFFGVMYELYHEAKLPPIKVVGKFRAKSFYKFVQEIDVEERVCAEDDYKETLKEIMKRSESKTLTIDPGSAEVDKKVLDQIRSWAQGSLDDAAERLMIEALPVENPEEARKWYQEQDIEDVRKEVTRKSISDFTLRYKEHAYIEVNINPQGVMPNITTLKDKEGKPIVWEDYAEEVDLNHPFFKQINATVKVNAPFDELPIHSIEVKLNYKGEPMDVIGSAINGEFQFSKADDVAHFASFIKDDDFNYTYSYQVNYKGASKIFQSEEITTDESVLTINADATGILSVAVIPGDVDFDQVKQVQITMEYEDRSNGVDKITDQFIMDKDNPNHKFEHIIFSKRSKPYKYKVNYKMSNGKEFETDWVEGNSNRLFINDPFTQSKTVGFRASGDLTTDIANIFIDATYKDEANDYVVTQSIALSKDLTFFDWLIPLVDESINTITYKGHIVKINGTQEEIPEKTSDASTIIVGENVEDLMSISINPALLDFAGTLKLAIVHMEYVDTDNDIKERKDFTFKEGAAEEAIWNIKLKDKSKTKYSWKASYFFKDGSRKETEKTEADDLTILPEPPTN
ncbi:hypothetical protein [Lacinutrix chionoecetis]